MDIEFDPKTFSTGGFFSRMVASDIAIVEEFFIPDMHPLDAPQLIPCGSAHKYAQLGTFHERESNG